MASLRVVYRTCRTWRLDDFEAEAIPSISDRLHVLRSRHDLGAQEKVKVVCRALHRPTLGGKQGAGRLVPRFDWVLLLEEKPVSSSPAPERNDFPEIGYFPN